MQKWINKNTILSSLLLLVALAIVIRITPPFVPKVIELEISQNRQPIGHIEQDRDIEHSRSVWVDRLDLFARNQLRHARLGQVGYTYNFFVDIEHEFEVKQAGRYRFIVGSDDGFILQVNGNELCRFNRDRAYVKQTCYAQLTEGTHEFMMNYFQAGGGAGLTVEYMLVGESRTFFFGEDSEFMAF